MEEITKETNKDAQRQNEQKSEQTGKTFTQEEVNRIVSDRLARDRDKRAAELDEREKAVKARELAVIAAEKLSAAGLPKELSGVLKYDDEASIDAAIEQISRIKGQRDGDQTQNCGKKIIIENKLPESIEHDNEESLLREAFRLHHE